MQKLDLDDLQAERKFQGMRAYANSKLCNILFARALSSRLDKQCAVVHAVHPGVVSTRFAANNGLVGSILRRLMDVVSISPERGADTIVWLAQDGEALSNGGKYWKDRELRQPSRDALDNVNAEALWRRSADLAGIGRRQPGSGRKYRLPGFRVTIVAQGLHLPRNLELGPRST